MEKQKFSNFNIIRHRGVLNKAQLPDGTWVERMDKIFIPEVGRFIPCAAYDDHFIYEIPQKLAKMYPGPSYKCTCGAAAGWTGPSGYILDASAQGLMFVCLIHAQTGLHATGGARWI